MYSISISPNLLINNFRKDPEAALNPLIQLPLRDNRAIRTAGAKTVPNPFDEWTRRPASIMEVSIGERYR